MQSIDQLKALCKDVRADVVKMTAAAGSGHPGGSLSAVEAMVALYFSVMNHKPADVKWPDRDRFFLSKGHACPVVYSVMARSGYFPVDELLTLRKCGTRLQGHPSCKMLPGIEVSSGSLGQGLSVANGVAMSAKLDKKSFRSYCLLGDGELQEGQVWEAIMTAAHYKLDNVCAIVDYNGLQIDGDVEKVMGLAPLADKWRSFNWNVIEVDDGHDMQKMLGAFETAKNFKGKPSVIIMKTVKGKGVSFMENVAGWHGKCCNLEEMNKAMDDIYGRGN
jgi:transketolase